MANNPDTTSKSKYESYHEIPASRYIFLFNTAIHKRLFLYWTLISITAIWISTRFFMIDFLILNFHLQNWWLFFPEATIVFFSLRIWNWSRTSEKKKRQKQAKEQLQKLIHEAGGETAK